MHILGLDPGSRSTGIAIINSDCKNPKIIYSNSLDLCLENDEFFSRLFTLFKQISNIVKEFQPRSLAMESLIHVKNVNSLTKLAQARGVAIVAANMNMPLSIAEYSPNLIKKSITGHGHADKEMIQKALGMIFGLNKFKSHDESDAIAIAFTHALHLRILTLKKQPAKQMSIV